MVKQESRRVGLTISAIKGICRKLEMDQTVGVVGLKSPDLYLRMINNEGVEAEAEKTKNGFIFKLKK